MTAVLAEAKQMLACHLDALDTSAVEPIFADPWVISSLLQKSIRRGDAEIAQRAARTFLMLKGSAIWRRLMVIAFEDVGVASPDTLTMTVAAGIDSALRRKCGGDPHTAVSLARLLAETAKDRSSDYLVGASDHPALSDIAHAMARSSVEASLGFLCNPNSSLPDRAVAARAIWGPAYTPNNNDLAALFAAFRSMGTPENLVVATEIAATRTREPITVMVPLIWLAASTGQISQVVDYLVPRTTTVGGVPMYALDMHTRLGRQAIGRFVRENDRLRECLNLYTPGNSRLEAAYVAAFYADATPLWRRLVWDQSEKIEKFGIERDFTSVGVALRGIDPIIQAAIDNLDHLNEVREDVFRQSRPG